MAPATPGLFMNMFNKYGSFNKNTLEICIELDLRPVTGINRDDFLLIGENIPQ